MLRLEKANGKNVWELLKLRVSDDQRSYVASNDTSIIEAYTAITGNARVFVIEADEVIVGVALVREFTDEPLGYDLQQFMIDQRYQGKGYGSIALGLILDELRKEGHFDHVEVCVKKDDAAAIHLYEKHGFVDSGFVDENLPDSVNMICYL